ncbi:hypothetical protein [Romboutsia hominis]|nr:hypothetical protein [Romboutsia hominis]
MWKDFRNSSTSRRPNVLQYLVDTFNIRPISTPDNDLATFLGVLKKIET